jgi:hypothetical protein
MTKDEWQSGTKILASWKGPRKRKCIHVSWSGATFESAFEGLKDWRKKNGGIVLSGQVGPCQRRKVETDRESYWMVMESIYSQEAYQQLTTLQIDEINQ